MLTQQRFLAASAIAVIVCAAAAQLAPTCCKYLGNWPAEGNPSGACAGTSTTVCLTNVDGATINDPLAKRYIDDSQPAYCSTITLSGDVHFHQQPCSWPPPYGGIYIISVRLPNGQCCYIIGEPEEVSTEHEYLGYTIPACSGGCASGPPN